MALLLLILDQPKSQGVVTLQVRDDMTVDLFVSLLVKHLHFPKMESSGVPVTYRLYTIADGRSLLGHQSFRDLGIQSGARIFVGVDEAVQPTEPIAFRKAMGSVSQQRFSRRAVLPLMTVSTIGLFSGASTALAQRVWGSIAKTPSPLRATPRAQQKLRFAVHTATVRTVAWSPDGRSLSSGADDAMLLLWMPDGTVRERLTLPDAIRSVAWSPGGKRLTAGSGKALAFVNAETGHLLALRQAHRATVTSVAWSTHLGNPVVSGSLDRRVLVWETQKYQVQATFARHTAPVHTVTASSGDGHPIASSSEGGVTRVWSLDTLLQKHGFYQDATVAMLSAAFAPNGQQLAVGGQDAIIRVWGRSLGCQRSVVTGTEQQCVDAPMRLHGHTAAVRAVVWSSDGRYLATGGDDAQVIVWDGAANFAQVLKMIHDAPVNAISWSPSHQVLATASGNTVQIWEFQFP